MVFADGYGLSGLKISGTWPGVGPFATLPTFDFNTGLRPLSTETLTAFPYFDSSTAVAIGGRHVLPAGDGEHVAGRVAQQRQPDDRSDRRLG